MTRGKTYRVVRILLGIAFLAMVLSFAIAAGTPAGHDFHSIKMAVAIGTLLLGGLIAVILWRFPRLRQETKISNIAQPIVRAGSKRHRS